MKRVDTISGYYTLIFLYLEPFSEISPTLWMILWGPGWFYNELVPPTGPPPAYHELDPRIVVGIWQLASTYILLALMSLLGFRAIRNGMSHDPVTQEKVLGAFLFCLAIADLNHIVLTVLHLPADIQYSPLQWNATTHGNVTFVGVLLISRICWFLGIGRERYYFGQPQITAERRKSARKGN